VQLKHMVHGELIGRFRVCTGACDRTAFRNSVLRLLEVSDPIVSLESRAIQRLLVHEHATALKTSLLPLLWIDPRVQLSL
jgi:hypothetical protein